MVLEVATARRTFVWREVWPARFRAPGVHARFFEAGCFFRPWAPQTYIFRGFFLCIVNNLVFQVAKTFIFLWVFGAHGTPNKVGTKNQPEVWSYSIYFTSKIRNPNEGTL